MRKESSPKKIPIWNRREFFTIFLKMLKLAALLADLSSLLLVAKDL